MTERDNAERNSKLHEERAKTKQIAEEVLSG